jgi:D-alanine-D-alanine ligase
MAKKLRVGIVFGGESGEHEVSLAGAASVMAAIDRDRFEPVQIGITREGRWLVGGDPLRALAQEAAGKALGEGGVEASVKQSLAARAGEISTSTALQRMESTEGLPPGLRERLDVVWIMLHGPRGEDGTIQGLLELAGLPYVGAGVLASAVGMDKVAMKDMFRAHGLPIVDYVAVKRHEDLPAALALAASHDRRILVERAVQGREVEVAVLGNDQPQASLPGEVCYAGEWYDYETKYGTGHTTFKVPAPLGPEVTRRVRELAVEAFRAIDCAGLARVDFFIEGASGVLVNEINTLPGFTASSAYPKLWEASGISYTELISRLIDLALERR